MDESLCPSEPAYLRPRAVSTEAYLPCARLHHAENETDPNGYSLIPVHVWTHTVADVAEVVQRIGAGFTVVTPEEYLRLVKQNLEH